MGCYLATSVVRFLVFSTPKVESLQYLCQFHVHSLVHGSVLYFLKSPNLSLLFRIHCNRLLSGTYLKTLVEKLWPFSE